MPEPLSLSADGVAEAPLLVPAASLGALGRDELAVAMRPLWEDAGPLVKRMVGRPVATWDEHIDLGEQEIAKMGESERVALLAAHPRIGTPPAALATRSPLSHGEQGGARGAEPEVLAALDALNDRYETRFGFPFVEWVAGRSRRDMLAAIEARLGRDTDTELAAGCAALVAIARDRLRRLAAS